MSEKQLFSRIMWAPDMDRLEEAMEFVKGPFDTLAAFGARLEEAEKKGLVTIFGGTNDNVAGVAETLRKAGARNVIPIQVRNN